MRKLVRAARVAGYRSTGTLTRPKLSVPDQTARGCAVAAGTLVPDERGDRVRARERDALRGDVVGLRRPARGRVSGTRFLPSARVAHAGPQDLLERAATRLAWRGLHESDVLAPRLLLHELAQ